MWGVSVESLLVSGCPQEIISPSEAELNYRIILEKERGLFASRQEDTPWSEDPFLVVEVGEEARREGWKVEEERTKSAQKRTRSTRLMSSPRQPPIGA